MKTKLEEELGQAVESMIDAIKRSEAYVKYQEALAAAKQQPELKQEIDEFRRKNYIMQSNGDMAFEHIEQFEREYSDFRENPVVAACIYPIQFRRERTMCFWIFRNLDTRAIRSSASFWPGK